MSKKWSLVATICGQYLARPHMLNMKMCDLVSIISQLLDITKTLAEQNLSFNISSVLMLHAQRRTRITLLSSWPLGKILTGQSILGLLKIPLVDFQNPGPQKFQEMIEGGLAKYIIFFYMCSWCLEFLATRIYADIHVGFFSPSWNKFHTSGNALAPMWILTWIVTYTQLAVSCLWNEVHNIRKHMRKKHWI